MFDDLTREDVVEMMQDQLETYRECLDGGVHSEDDADMQRSAGVAKVIIGHMTSDAERIKNLEDMLRYVECQLRQVDGTYKGQKVGSPFRPNRIRESINNLIGEPEIVEIPGLREKYEGTAADFGPDQGKENSR